MTVFDELSDVDTEPHSSSLDDTEVLYDELCCIESVSIYSNLFLMKVGVFYFVFHRRCGRDNDPTMDSLLYNRRVKEDHDLLILVYVRS